MTPVEAGAAAASDTTGAGVAATAAATAGVAAAAVAADSASTSDDRPAAAGDGWSQPVSRQPSGGFMFGTLLGVVGLIIGAALIAWFISSRMGGTPDAAAPVVAAAPAAPAPAAPTPAPAPATPPEGAGVVATEVAGRPMVSVYFDTASALISSDFGTSAAPIVAWLAAHPEDMAQVSGFNDPRGNAAFNADLSRRRAEGVAAELRRLGVPDNQIDLEPPASATDTTTNLAGARRVEITVVPLR
jgi:outer membrane protein OmpA-like peptidoglycan-associated protein